MSSGEVEDNPGPGITMTASNKSTSPIGIGERERSISTSSAVSENQQEIQNLLSTLDVEGEQLSQSSNTQDSVQLQTMVSEVSLITCEQKAQTLATFIVLTLLGQHSGRTNDKVEETLLRCVNAMLKKHQILFKGMTRRLDVTPETGYMTFTAVANELFEGENLVVSWGRIVALYSFGGTLAMDYKEKNMDDLAINIATFMGRYASEVVAPFVERSGGWEKLYEEFPPENNLENQAWNFLTWTAIGLGIISAVTFFTSPP